MKAPISWLKQYVDTDVDVETLCEKMVSIGFEIESVEYLGNKFSNVKVGQITEITKHPDADKLQVCQVNMGEETIQITFSLVQKCLFLCMAHALPTEL